MAGLNNTVVTCIKEPSDVSARNLVNYKHSTLKIFHDGNFPIQLIIYFPMPIQVGNYSSGSIVPDAIMTCQRMRIVMKIKEQESCLLV